MKIISEILSAIKKSRTFFIAGHTKPDGDTVGSGIALASLLRRLGKKVTVYSLEPVPQYLTFLKESKNIKIQKKVPGRFDCAIILECIGLERMGSLIDESQAGILINIDHHSLFSEYGHINYIDPKASSSAELIYNIFNQLGMHIRKNEAEALYVALVTDTGRFQQANTTPKSLRMAAELVEAGVVPTEIYNNLYSTTPLPSLKLLGRSLETLETIHNGKIAYIEITNRMFKETKTTAADTEGIINYLMMIPGVMAGVLFRETETKDLIKISMRSKDSLDISRAAKQCGGGGHKNAAGCSIQGSLKQVEKSFLAYMRKLIK